MTDIKIFNWKGFHDETISSPTLTLRDHVPYMPSTHQSIMRHVIFPQDDGAEIVQCLNEGHLLTGSDGSVKAGRGSCAFCIGDLGFLNSMKGAYICPSYKNETSSLRAELYGALGIVLCIQLITKHNNTHLNTNANVWAYIDNDTVIKRINNNEQLTPKQTLVPEYELTEELMSILTTLPCPGTWRWIKGHNEDDDTPPGHMNRVMDSEANRMRKSFEIVENVCSYPSNKVTIRKNGAILHSNEFQKNHI